MMQVITTVTQKGQITLPKAIREAFNIDKYDKVTIEAKEDYIKIKPTFDILDIAGTFHPRRKKSVLKAREYMETHYKRV